MKEPIIADKLEIPIFKKIILAMLKKRSSTAFSSIFLLQIGLVFSQIAIIEDRDGYTNVREAPGLSSEIIHKVFEDEVFWYEESKDTNWVFIHIPRNKFSLGCDESSNITGYIHRSRLLPLEKLSHPGEEEFSFKYSLSKFKSEGRNILLQNDKWVRTIDGRQPWGTDGILPEIQIDSIEVKIGTQIINIHPVFYQDLFEVSDNFEVYRLNRTFFVSQTNSDGAGTYDLAWVFKRGQLIQRLIGTIY